MKIKDLLSKENIFFGVQVPGNDKKHALKEISKLCAKCSNLSEHTLYKTFLGREKVESTGFGSGVAIPHAKLDRLKEPFIAIVHFAEPVNWDSIDGKPVEVAIALVMPTVDKDNTHLQVLSYFSRKLVDESFIDRLLKAEDKDQMYQCVLEEMGED
ncbi:MAG TPA: PTS fructose transporter subunit IIA [Ruminococcaceae bacterium]|nr:PTS fructose transporter subunit IIA [Oscillospiraceae bacterium]